MVVGKSGEWSRRIDVTWGSLMTLLRSKLLATTVIAGFTLLVPGLAMAQDNTQTDAEKAAAAQAAADEDKAKDDNASEVEAVVVTGSRIRRNEFTSAAPIQVITAEQSTLEGLVDTTEILQQSSVAAGSFQVNNQLTGFVVTGGNGANTISLRGLGATRTLVLLNGRRVGPAGIRGTVGPVDLNVIPSAMVERFEILKDGASSIYGSDAVAGVVNIITKSNLDGVVLDVFTDQPLQQGGAQYRANAAWGKTFDRGYVNVALDYYEQKVLRRGDRDDTSCAVDYEFNGTTHARLDYTNTDPGQVADGQYKCWNTLARVLRTGSYGDLIYPDPGVTYPTAAQGNSGGTANLAGNFGATPTPFGFVRQTRAGFPLTFPYAHNDAEALQRSSVVSPVKRYSLYASAGFDVSDNIEFYSELLLNRRESVQYGYRQLFPGISTANANNPYGTTLGSLLPIIPLKVDRGQTVDYWRGVVGLRGDITGGFLDGWSWDVYAQRSSSRGEYTTDIIYNDRVNATTLSASACNQAAITISGSLPNGQCATALPGGVPWLSARILNGDFNAAERAFLFTNETGNTSYDQDQVEVSLTGDWFSLPAGKVGVAVGASWRHDKIDDIPGFNEQHANLWGSSAAGRTKGSDTVREAFGEIEAPLIKGVPLIESLDLQASGRYTDYDSYGSDTTWKLGLNWQITPNWRLRATKGTSFRAPALYELYLAHQTSFLGQTSIDPCILYENSGDPILMANCAADNVPLNYTAAGSSSALISTGGGAGNLKAETSVAESVGLIWTPDFLDLSVAVDYFDITVNNEIRSYGAANILSSCYRSPTFPSSPFCGLFVRNDAPGAPPPTPPSAGVHAIQTVDNNYVNVAEQVNRGIDLTVRYQHEWDFGKLTIDSQFTWQLHDTTQLFGNFAPSDYNGATFGFDGPDFTGNLNIRFDHGDWTAFWGMDILGKASDTELYGTDTFASTRFSQTCRIGGPSAGQTLAPGTIGNCSTLLGGGPLTVLNGANDPNGFVYFKQYTEMTITHDVSLRKKMDTWTFQIGVQNVFDEKGPAQSAAQFRVGSFALNGFDPFGRRVFIDISKRW